MGDKGSLELNSVAGLPSPSRWICSDRPRPVRDGLVGVVGLENVSSLDTRLPGSRNAGDGDRVGFGASERERGFGEFIPVLRDEDEVGVRSPSSSHCVKLDFPTVDATWSAMVVAVDMALLSN